jgi:hypothetical protein
MGNQHEWHKINSFKVFLRKPEGRRPLGRSKFRWVDNIKLGLKNIS